MNARSIMQLSRSAMPGMTSLSGYTKGAGMDAKQFQDAAAHVGWDDLAEIGVTPTRRYGGAAGLDAVDPDTMKFDAMMALKKAKQSGMPTRFAEERVADAEMAAAGRDEVLRRRQKDFNEAASAPQLSDTYGEAYSYMRPDQKISGLTGAAIASQARAGKFQPSMPQEQHDPIFKTRSILSGLSRARGSY